MSNFSIETLGIVGTGAMGRGIAQIAAQAGLTVNLFDTNPQAVAAARQYLQDTFAKLADKGKISATDAEAFLARVKPCNALEDLASCDMVLEAIVEKLDVKRDLIARLEAIVRPEAIIASNTSSLSITAIAVGAKHPGRVAGYHFFNPVPLMKVVEVIDGLSGDPAIGDALMVLSRRMGHTPVRCKDMPGFIVNHAGRGMNIEGLKVAQEGVASFAEIDNIMREQAGFRMGPFELMDLTGIDVNFPARKIIYEGFFHDRRMTPSPYHESLYAAGKLGRKTGGGWYAYDAKGGKVDPGADHLPSVEPAKSVVIMDTHNQKLVSLVNADGAKMLGADDGKSPILVAPIGKDCTTTAIELGLDPKRTVAVDLTGDTAKRLTIMTAPGADPVVRDSVAALLAKSGAKVTLIKDSPGFIAQRMVAMIANLGCEMAMIGIASAADVDTAMTLGLNYPRGPLALADWLGVKECHEILAQAQAITGDDRYRPSQWLRRRAQLGLSATTVE